MSTTNWLVGTSLIDFTTTQLYLQQYENLCISISSLPSDSLKKSEEQTADSVKKSRTRGLSKSHKKHLRDLLDEGRSSISSSGKFSCSASWSLRCFLWDLLKPLVLLFFTESAVCSSDFLRESEGKEEMLIQRFSYCCRYSCVVVKSMSDVPTNQFVVLILCLSECYHSYSGCGQYSTASGHSINTVSPWNPVCADMVK